VIVAKSLTDVRGHYGINDNWPWLLKYREAVRLPAKWWIDRSSQTGSRRWESFRVRKQHYPLASPFGRLLAYRPEFGTRFLLSRILRSAVSIPMA